MTEYEQHSLHRQSNGRLLDSIILPIAWCGFVVFLLPYLLLFWLSLGSGWTYPSLTPDRMDLRPWMFMFGTSGSAKSSIVTSGLMAVVVASMSTLLGMLVGRHVQAHRGVWMFLAYLPFASSPVIVGICLLDLLIRLGLASTAIGVGLTQLLFAAAYAIILFSELWSADIARREQVVVTLGGNSWYRWRHAVWPRLRTLVVVCWLQTFLFSWLDYSIVSTIGGGVVPSLTLTVITHIRDGSVNDVAQAAMVLLVPPMLFMSAIALLTRGQWKYRATS